MSVKNESVSSSEKGLQLIRDVAMAERENKAVVNVGGIEIGIRYPEDIIDQLKYTPELKEAGILSRSEKGHGYIMVEVDDNKIVKGYRVPMNDWEADEDNHLNKKEKFIKEKNPYLLEFPKQK